jgi:predicted PurR-regulated permease PerM
MNDRFVTQRNFFFCMVAILALILIWQITRAILLSIALVIPLVILLTLVYNWHINKRSINGRASRATAITIFFFALIITIPAVLINRTWMPGAVPTG